MKNSKINVLHIIDKFSMDGVNPSSCTRLFEEWIPRFNKDVFDVKVCTLRDPDPAGKILEEKGIRVFYINKGKMSLGNIGEISRLIQQENIDIVHLHGYSAANFGRIAARKMGIKNIVHEHAVLKVLPHQFLADWLLRKKTDVAIGVCQVVKEFMIRGRSIPEDKIRIIFNGVDVKKYTPLSTRSQQDIRETFNIPPGTRVVGTITRLRKEKGNDIFLRAIPDIVKRENKVRFLIVGEGPEKEALKNLAAQLGIEKYVVFTGFRKDVSALLSLFDIKVIPSLSEGFPLAFLEALASGRAIVASAVGSISEVSVDGETALLVPPGDAKELSAKIIQLLQDDFLREKLGKNAREEAKKYSIESNVQALESLYTSLMNGM